MRHYEIENRLRFGKYMVVACVVLVGFTLLFIVVSQLIGM